MLLQGLFEQVVRQRDLFKRLLDEASAPGSRQPGQLSLPAPGAHANGNAQVDLTSSPLSHSLSLELVFLLLASVSPLGAAPLRDFCLITRWLFPGEKRGGKWNRTVIE